jgi:glycosyltransferase involved in cell wall biosynthesis
MRILAVAGPLHREFGGPPMAATGIASALANLGYSIKIIVCGQSVQDSSINSVFFNKLQKSGAEIQILRRRKESKYGALLRFSEIKSLWNDVEGADFIILHQIFELQYIAIFPILFAKKKPYAIMPHGTLTNYQRNQHRFRKFLFAPATYFLLKSAKAIFVATDLERSQLPKKTQGMGITVGLGVEEVSTEFQKSLESTSTFNLLYMGRITKKKRLDVALRAFALATKRSDIQMRFIVCGSGEKRDMQLITELVKTLEIESLVDFRGWVDFSEKQQAFLDSDCFILTSEDENFAIAAAEALAHGIPCILSSNVALASLVSKYKAGSVFQELNQKDITDAIIQVSVIDKELSKNSSLLAASELSWEVIAKQWASSIRLLLNN